jgi:telomerase reverse transcriptase
VLNRYPHKLKDLACNSNGDARGLKNNCKDGVNGKVLQSTIHVIMYIFPRQFGLHNVFTSTVDQRETVQPLKDYTLREDEIACKYGPLKSKSEIIIRSKVPRRLRGSIIDLVQKLRINHSRCPYHKLLMHYCPTHVRTHDIALN